MSKFRYLLISLLVITISFSFLAIYRLNIPNEISFLWYSDFYNEFTNGERINSSLEYKSFDTKNINVSILASENDIEKFKALRDDLGTFSFDFDSKIYLIAYTKTIKSTGTCLKFDKVLKRGKDIFVKLCINNQMDDYVVALDNNKTKKGIVAKKKMYYDIICFQKSSIGSDGLYNVNFKDQYGNELYDDIIYLNVNN